MWRPRVNSEEWPTALSGACFGKPSTGMTPSIRGRIQASLLPGSSPEGLHGCHDPLWSVHVRALGLPLGCRIHTLLSKGFYYDSGDLSSAELLDLSPSSGRLPSYLRPALSPLPLDPHGGPLASSYFADLSDTFIPPAVLLVLARTVKHVLVLAGHADYALPSSRDAPLFSMPHHPHARPQ